MLMISWLERQKNEGRCALQARKIEDSESSWNE